MFAAFDYPTKWCTHEEYHGKTRVVEFCHEEA